MIITVLFTFTNKDEGNNAFLLSGDLNWLKSNIFHEGEFYEGMLFDHEGHKYKLNKVGKMIPQYEYIYWSPSDSDEYYGDPCEANFDIYLECSKVN
ncbi:hypothetical protein [Sphingobacterium detergens]|uniref:hypothetical protein n=1 Tax=Sphingobacterium detergens TaxID=1145106 RepID=UPI003AB082A8